MTALDQLCIAFCIGFVAGSGVATLLTIAAIGQRVTP